MGWNPEICKFLSLDIWRFLRASRWFTHKEVQQIKECTNITEHTKYLLHTLIGLTPGVKTKIGKECLTAAVYSETQKPCRNTVPYNPYKAMKENITDYQLLPNQSANQFCIIFIVVWNSWNFLWNIFLFSLEMFLSHLITLQSYIQWDRFPINLSALLYLILFLTLFRLKVIVICNFYEHIYMYIFFSSPSDCE